MNGSTTPESFSSSTFGPDSVAPAASPTSPAPSRTNAARRTASARPLLMSISSHRRPRANRGRSGPRSVRGGPAPARGRLSTWLMAIAHNMAVDRLRHDHGAARPVMVLVDAVPEPAPADEEEGVLDRETARRALAGISPAERHLLSQAYFFGRTAR